MSLGDRRRRVGTSSSRTKKGRSGDERRPVADHGSAPIGSKAGYAGEDATWSRDRLSRHHIISGHNFAASAASLEGEDPGERPTTERWKYRAYVTSSVLSATAFLEASINELYLEIRKLSQPGELPLRRELSLLVQAWPQIARAPMLTKYQLALSVTDADQYNESATPYVEVDYLMRLREALLSYNLEWDDNRGVHHTLEEDLKDQFPPSPLVSVHRPWFPDRCLGSGCARWAVRVVQEFSNDFYRRMALPARPLVGGHRSA